mgnify:CR=1 FL=1
MLVANQPSTRLHSQLDFGGHSAEAKHRGREVARMHPDDAAARGIADGDIVRLFNARGACLGRASASRTASGAASFSCPPAPGTTPWIRGGDAPLRARQPERASPAMSGPLRSPRAAPGSSRPSRSSASRGNLPPIQAFDGRRGRRVKPMRCELVMRSGIAAAAARFTRAELETARSGCLWSMGLMSSQAIAAR